MKFFEDHFWHLWWLIVIACFLVGHSGSLLHLTFSK